MSDPILKTLRVWLYGAIALGAWNAQALEPIIYEGVDISPIVEYFGKQVVTMKKPVFVYNWSPGGSNGDGLGLYPMAQRSGKSFWNNYGGDAAGNVYGVGLYAAVDPVYTVDFAHSKVNPTKTTLETALLLEMQLPTGFRFLDLQREDKPKYWDLSPEVKKLISNFGCLEATAVGAYTTSYLGTHFVAGGAPQPKSCQGLIKKVFKDLLQIDGFAYGYGSAQLKGCESFSFYNGRAFVITRSEWMRPDLIQFFNRNSKHDLERRRLIQTLFINKTNETMRGILSGFQNTNKFQQISDYLDLHPDSEIQSYTNTCDDMFCTVSVRFCESKDQTLKCDEVNLDRQFRPGGELILAKDALSTSFKGLFWSDLDGQPKAKTVETWAVENLFGCTNESPYEEAP